MPDVPAHGGHSPPPNNLNLMPLGYNPPLNIRFLILICKSMLLRGGLGDGRRGAR